MVVHTVHIDSRDRDLISSSTPAEYLVRLPRTFRKVVSARLLSAEIPSSFYVFRSEYGNTSVNVSVNGSPLHSITIPDGNYTGSTLSAALRSALNTAFAPLTFTVTLSKSTLKMTFVNLDGYDMTINTTTETTETREWGLGYYLGFPKDEVFTGSVITAPRVASTNPYTYLVLDIEELNGAHEGGIDGTQLAPHGCFAKIPFAANSFEYVFMDASASSVHPTTYRPPITSLDRLRIRWRFHDGRLVNFEELEHSFTLEIIEKDREEVTVQAAAVQAVQAAAVQAATDAAEAVTRVAQALETPPNAPQNSQKNPPNAEEVQRRTKKLHLILCGVAMTVLVLWLITRRRPKI